MRPKSKGRERTIHATPPRGQPGPRSTSAQHLQPAMLAVSHQLPPPAPPSDAPNRPTLPPLSHLQSHNAIQPPASSLLSPAPAYDPSSGYASPATSSLSYPTLLAGLRPIRVRLGIDEYNASTAVADPEYSPGDRPRSFNPLKRTYEPAPPSGARSTQSAFLSDTIDAREFPTSSGTNSTDTTTPTTATSGYPHGNTMLSPLQSESSASTNAGRCSLFIRQQPRAARAGPDGKDRRPIDPPPVLQLMMNDFDPNSPADVAEIRSTFWVVHCRLVSAQSPKKDLSTLSSTAEDGSREIQRLLLGTAVASPFQCTDDPDPESMPSHPVVNERSPGPPSPSSRFLPAPSSRSDEKGKGKAAATVQIPGAFFIFADLSIRKAGEYRLEFSLMKVEANVLYTGSTLPIIHSVTSQVFKVVNAKDFDQVQPSTNLVKGLLERGAGFPLKLKKGTREGQRRRGPGGRSEEGDDSDEEDDEL